jgi:hypothetical protein
VDLRLVDAVSGVPIRGFQTTNRSLKVSLGNGGCVSLRLFELQLVEARACRAVGKEPDQADAEQARKKEGE